MNFAVFIYMLTVESDVFFVKCKIVHNNNKRDMLEEQLDISVFKIEY